MSEDKPNQNVRGALADIQALVRAALESADPVVMRHDLEMILTITEEALQPRGPEFKIKWAPRRVIVSRRWDELRQHFMRFIFKRPEVVTRRTSKPA